MRVVFIRVLSVFFCYIFTSVCLWESTNAVATFDVYTARLFSGQRAKSTNNRNYHSLCTQSYTLRKHVCKIITHMLVHSCSIVCSYHTHQALKLFRSNTLNCVYFTAPTIWQCDLRPHRCICVCLTLRCQFDGGGVSMFIHAHCVWVCAHSRESLLCWYGQWSEKNSALCARVNIN